MKEEAISSRSQEVEELDKKVVELERLVEATEIKRQGVERQFELSRKQLGEKIQ